MISNVLCKFLIGRSTFQNQVIIRGVNLKLIFSTFVPFAVNPNVMEKHWSFILYYFSYLWVSIEINVLPYIIIWKNAFTCESNIVVLDRKALTFCILKSLLICILICSCRGSQFVVYFYVFIGWIINTKNCGKSVHA